MATTELSGIVRIWGLSEESKREYIAVTIDYGVARTIFKEERFNIKTGKGEQRATFDAHVRKICKAMKAGKFVPTVIHVGTRDHHRKAMGITAGKAANSRVCTLKLPEGQTLPITNGKHRCEALERIRKEYVEMLAKASTVEERTACQAMIDLVDRQPVTALILLDGDTQEDFVHLNINKAIDAAHLLSLKVASKTYEGKDADAMNLAFAVARKLHDHRDSPFHRMVKFDSEGMAPLPVSSLCSKGSSDLGTSLVGIAKFALSEEKPVNAETVAYAVIGAYKALKAHAPELLEGNRVLTPPPDGTKGSAGMLIGIGLALLVRCRLAGQKIPDERSLSQLVAAARETLDFGLDDLDSFSGPTKRRLLGNFVREFFGDVTVDKHDQIPLVLVKALSPSAFGSKSKLSAKSSSLPDVDGELPAAPPEPVEDEPRQVEWNTIDPTAEIEPEEEEVEQEECLEGLEII